MKDIAVLDIFQFFINRVLYVILEGNLQTETSMEHHDRQGRRHRGGRARGAAIPLSFAKNEKKKRKKKKKEEGEEEKGRRRRKRKEKEECFTAFTDNLQVLRGIISPSDPRCLCLQISCCTD